MCGAHCVFPVLALLNATIKRSTLLMRRIEYFDLEHAAYDLIDSAKTKEPNSAMLIAQRFAIELGKARRYHLRKCVVHRGTGPHIKRAFQEELSNVQWDKIVDVLVDLSLSDVLKEQLASLLSSLDADHVISKRFCDESARAETNRVNALLRACEDVIAYANQVGKGPPDFDGHYRDLVHHTIAKSIPAAWSQVNPSWSSLRRAIRDKQLERVRMSIEQMGLNWNKCLLTRDILTYLLALEDPPK